MTLEELREDHRPADLWFWADWFSSFDVRSCSLAARGLWVDILGIMSRSKVKGALIINGSKPDIKTLAKIVGATEKEIELRLKELEKHSVFSRLGDGTIINRRMYRASQLSKARAEAGKRGAFAKWQTDGKDVENVAGKDMANQNGKNTRETDGKCMANTNGKDMANIEDEYIYKNLKGNKNLKRGKISLVFEDDKPVRFENITEKDLALWEKSYPACDLEVELSRMIVWLRENPAKRKKNHGRFIANWLSRTQDRGGTRGMGPARDRAVGAQQPRPKPAAEKEYDAALETAEDEKKADLNARLEKGEITQAQAQDELGAWREMWNEQWKRDHPF